MTADYANKGQFQGGAAHPSAQREAHPKDLTQRVQASKKARQVSTAMTKAALRQAIERAIARNPRPTAQRVTLSLSTVPPSVNGMYANKKAGGRQKTEGYRAWRTQAVSELRSIQRAPLVPGRVSISLLIGRPNAASDLDGRIKGTLDALQDANVIENDKLVDHIDVRWAEVEGVLIEVRGA